MHEHRPAFGQRLAEFAELGVIEFPPESLDAIDERRLKTTREERSVHTVVQIVFTPSRALTVFSVTAVTGKLPTHEAHRSTIQNSPGEFLIAFIFYADTLLSITLIAALLSSCYKTLYD